MLRHGILYFFVAAALLVFTGNAAASWSFHITNDNMDATWEIWLLTDETLTTNGYGLAFAYDYTASELEWQSGYTNTPTAGLSADLMGLANEPENGSIDNFNAGRVMGTSTITADMQIGTITLSYGNGRQPVLNDLTWDTSNQMFTIDMNGTSYSGAELAAAGHLTNAAVPAVPLPGAFWLLGTGLTWIAGIRSRMKL